NEQRGKLNNGAVEWITGFKNEFTALKKVGSNFIYHIGAFMKKEAVIEKNKGLQNRINDAANHFGPKFLALQNNIQNHPLITEHRETAATIDEHLNELLLRFHLQNYYLQYCKEPFSITTFLQHKIRYVQLKLNLSAYASGKKQSSSSIANAQLFDTLKRWRDIVCEDNHLPIYLVANQNALKEITTYLPFTKKDLMKLSGFGAAKANKYGDDILDIVRDYCSRNNLESNMASKADNPKKDRKEKSTEQKTPTHLVSFNLFKEGKTIEEIAKQRNLAVSTIQGHLLPFIASKQININDLISPDKQKVIKEAIRIHGSDSTKTLNDNLPDDISYGEIKMVIAAEKAGTV
ncbi:MAG: helix-turn-helix domain-containing protein, partial [Flavisolibacter sp.]